MSELRINNITDRAGSSGPIIAGEYPSYNQRSLQYITIATTGNGLEFGDLNGTRGDGAGFSSPTRAVCALGASSSDKTVDFVQIMTTGNALDFGDLNQGSYEFGGNSNGHGGLG